MISGLGGRCQLFVNSNSIPRQPLLYCSATLGNLLFMVLLPFDAFQSHDFMSSHLVVLFTALWGLTWLKLIQRDNVHWTVRGWTVDTGHKDFCVRVWQVIIGSFSNKWHPNIPSILSNVPTCPPAPACQCLSLVAAGLFSHSFVRFWLKQHWLKTVVFVPVIIRENMVMSQKELTLGCLFSSHLKYWYEFHSHKLCPLIIRKAPQQASNNP